MGKHQRWMGILLVAVLLVAAAAGLAETGGNSPVYLWLEDESASGCVWEYSFSGQGQMEERKDEEASAQAGAGRRLTFLYGVKPGQVDVALRLVDPKDPSLPPREERVETYQVLEDLSATAVKDTWKTNVPKGTGDRVLYLSLPLAMNPAEGYVNEWRYEQSGQGRLKESDEGTWAAWQEEIYRAQHPGEEGVFLADALVTGNTSRFFAGEAPGQVTLRLADVVDGKEECAYTLTLQVYEDLTVETLATEFVY